MEGGHKVVRAAEETTIGEYASTEAKNPIANALASSAVQEEKVSSAAEGHGSLKKWTETISGKLTFRIALGICCAVVLRMPLFWRQTVWE